MIFFLSGFLYNAAVLLPEQRGVQHGEAALGALADHQGPRILDIVKLGSRETS